MWSSDSDLEMLDLLSDWSDLSSDDDDNTGINRLFDQTDDCILDYNNEIPDDISMYCEDDTSTLARDAQSKDYETVFDSFRCSVCDSVISEFRYTCVQCNDFDLCSACETNRAHHHHYVLRVPAPRPFAEIQYVLSTIRRHLMKRLDPITNCDHDGDDVFSVKSELKVEIENDDYDNNGDVEDNGDEDNDGSENSDVDKDDNDDNIESDDNNDDSEASDTQEPKSKTRDDTATRSEIAQPDNKDLETPDFAIDISIKEEPDSECLEVEQHPPSTDAIQMTPASSNPAKHQMIVIKRANIVNVKDSTPSAKKLCVIMSNSTPRGSEGKVIRVTSFNTPVRPQKPETGQECTS